MARGLRDRGFTAYALRGGPLGWRASRLPMEPKEVERGHTLVDICPRCGRRMSEHAA